MKPLDFYNRVRADMARELGLKPDDLTLQQRLHLDLVTTLRLEIDAVQARQLQGEAADINKLLAAVEALQNLIRPAAMSGPLNAARVQFEALVNKYVAANEIVENEEVAALRREIAELRSANEALRSELVAPALPSPLPENVVQLSPDEKAERANAPAEQFHRAEPPQRYLRGPPEPWRFYTGDIWSNRQ